MYHKSIVKIANKLEAKYLYKNASSDIDVYLKNANEAISNCVRAVNSSNHSNKDSLLRLLNELNSVYATYREAINSYKQKIVDLSERYKKSFPSKDKMSLSEIKDKILSMFDSSVADLSIPQVKDAIEIAKLYKYLGANEPKKLDSIRPFYNELVSITRKYLEETSGLSNYKQLTKEIKELLAGSDLPYPYTSEKLKPSVSSVIDKFDYLASLAINSQNKIVKSML